MWRLLSFLFGFLAVLFVGAAVTYVVCSITVAVLNRYNLGSTVSKAIKGKNDQEAKKLIGKTLSGVVKERKKNGDITVITLDMMEDGEKVAEVSINSEYVSADISENQVFEKIAI